MKITRTMSLGFLILLLSAGVFVFGCTDGGTPTSDGQASGDVGAKVSLTTYESKMLDLAFTSASAMPENPHIKNKSRAQGSVVLACLELGDPVRALRFSTAIPNWRRELGLASYAYYCAQKGWRKDASRGLRMARGGMRELTEDKNEQAWRVERIALVMAATEHVLNQGATVSEESQIWMDPGLESLAEFANGLTKDVDFENFTAGLKVTFRSEDFAAVQLAFERCVAVFDRFYQDDERRNLLEGIVRTSYKRLPLDKRIALIISLSEAALEHGDSGTAARLANHASKRLANGRWRTRDEVAMCAKIAALKFKSGATEAALTDLASAHRLYAKSRLNIVSIFRGQALRPLAEAFVTLGNYEQARAIYSQALDEALLNPNSRPRAEELVAVCISMATNHCRWDADLKKKAHQFYQGLSAPW